MSRTCIGDNVRELLSECIRKCKVLLGRTATGRCLGAFCECEVIEFVELQRPVTPRPAPQPITTGRPLPVYNNIARTTRRSLIPVRITSPRALLARYRYNIDAEPQRRS